MRETNNKNNENGLVVLTATEVNYLLTTLCVELGFCLPPNDIARLQATPPADVDSFTEAVFIAEGYDLRLADRNLWRQVHEVVSAAFARAAATE